MRRSTEIKKRLMRSLLVFLCICFIGSGCATDSRCSEGSISSATKAYEKLKESVAWDSVGVLNGEDMSAIHRARMVYTCHPDSSARQYASGWIDRIENQAANIPVE
jgi:hypothetical protein